MVSQKTVWDQYGKYIIIAVVLTLMAIGAWKYREHQKQKELLAASLQYDKMMQAFIKKDKDISKVEEQAQLLVEQYSDTPYAAFAALMQARIKVDQNELAKAEEYLNHAIELGEDGPAAHVARVRLARVLAGEHKLEEALKVLSATTDNEGYVALYEETKGDIYVQQKDIEKAKAAYKAAEQALPPGVQVMALQLKQNDLNNESDEAVNKRSDAKESDNNVIDNKVSNKGDS